MCSFHPSSLQHIGSPYSGPVTTGTKVQCRQLLFSKSCILGGNNNKQGNKSRQSQVGKYNKKINREIESSGDRKGVRGCLQVKPTGTDISDSGFRSQAKCPAPQQSSSSPGWGRGYLTVISYQSVSFLTLNIIIIK